MRIVIAEDAVMLREGLCMLLTSRDHEVVAAVGDGDALLAAVAEHGPDVAVVDVRMPPSHTDEGLRAAIRIRHDHPEVGVLVFSQYIETRYAARLLAGGAHGVGYLLKERVADVKDFLAALDQIAAGQTVLDPEVVTQIMGASRRAEALGTLTPREREVLAMMAEGRSNSSIAAALFLSYGSVEKHVTQIFTKLGLSPSDNDHRRVLAVLHYLQA
ncbi:response regulator transcription factor [Nonomuraea sp. NPDC049725]|uniref:response regulator transcription factor n=1 Tax=Nonomuraea sp. NPDC049725 TaxID=3154508 RepID=UPI00342BF6E4